jgi:hypothetical protein
MGCSENNGMRVDSNPRITFEGWMIIIRAILALIQKSIGDFSEIPAMFFNELKLKKTIVRVKRFYVL